jgi:hypothetical protein
MNIIRDEIMKEFAELKIIFHLISLILNDLNYAKGYRGLLI